VKPWKPILAALVIFTAGVTLGGLAFSKDSPQDKAGRDDPRVGRSEHRGEGPRERRPWNWMGSDAHIRDVCDRMTRDLGLDPAQTQRIQGLIRESQSRMRAINEKMYPEIREEMRRARGEIREVLTPEQRAKFDEINKKRRPDNRSPGEGAKISNLKFELPDLPPPGRPRPPSRCAATPAPADPSQSTPLPS